MSLDEAFLGDICEHPEDDAPRLVYADWLEDNGDLKRAEFIRVQCELARLDERSPAAAVLQGRAAILLHRHEGRWSEPLRRLGVEWWVFRRGFVEVIALQGDDFVREAANLLATAPVRDVTLFALPPALGRLARCPQVARLTAMRLHQLLTGIPLPSLRTLELRQFTAAFWLIPLLARTRTLPALAELGLGQGSVNDRTLAALANAPLGVRLEALDLEDNTVTDAGARELASASLPRLRWLNLQGNPVGDAGITALLDSPRLPQLRHIGCDPARLSPDVLARVQARANGQR
jgi:uncharacterized protein (TIGR02996 family)